MKKLNNVKWLILGLVLGFVLTLNINYGKIYDFSIDNKWSIYHDGSHMITVPNKEYTKGDFIITLSSDIVDDVSYSFKLK